MKSLRNDLEHKFVVVHKSSNPKDIYGSYKFINDMVFINESKLVSSLEHIIQLTRSAIFSFTLMVRNEGSKLKAEGEPFIPMEIYRQNYE